MFELLIRFSLTLAAFRATTSFLRAVRALIIIKRGACAAVEDILDYFKVTYHIGFHCHLNLPLLLCLRGDFSFNGNQLMAVCTFFIYLDFGNLSLSVFCLFTRLNRFFELLYLKISISPLVRLKSERIVL